MTSVLQINTTDVGGGAAMCAWNLFRAYQQRGMSSWLAVGRRVSDEPGVLLIPGARKWVRNARVLWALHGRLQPWERGLPGIAFARDALRTVASGDPLTARWLGREDFGFPHSRRVLDLVPQRPQILHCHNLHGGFFDLRALVHLSRQVPTVLTLHDEWAFTGHCAHSLQCVRWRRGCGQPAPCSSRRRTSLRSPC